jgi:putative tricarboxylic transport membrane protein
VVDVWIMTVMGGLGYLLRKLDFETAPIVLGLVLAPMLEMSLRQSLALSSGSYVVFVTRPISATMLGVALALLLMSLRPLVAKGADWRRRLGLLQEPTVGEEEKK